jgi:aminoglycoside phosphotransferase (APT) family kinase protein
MIACPTVAPAVAASLLEYLYFKLGVSGLDYAEEPSQIVDGWETYIYRFRLRPARSLPAALTGPLILRVYSCIQGLPRLQHEFHAQQQMSRLGYSVARPILVEEDCDLFGGPFMIMESVPGRTLLDLLLNQPWRIVRGPAHLAEVHAQLHRLSAVGFPAPATPFLGRRLEEMKAIIDEYNLHGLRAGLRWLDVHRPPEQEMPSIIHLDFHPLNIMFHEGQCSGVLDWCESDVGDRHADVATTLVLMMSAPVQVPTFLQRLSTWPGRVMLVRRYLRAYRKTLPVDDQKLAYYMAWASFRRLCSWGRWLAAGPRCTGSKPSSMRYLSSDRVDILRRCFFKWSGVDATLRAAPGS